MACSVALLPKLGRLTPAAQLWHCCMGVESVLAMEMRLLPAMYCAVPWLEP
jgi:hypothetical protein